MLTLLLARFQGGIELLNGRLSSLQVVLPIKEIALGGVLSSAHSLILRRNALSAIRVLGELDLFLGSGIGEVNGPAGAVAPARTRLRLSANEQLGYVGKQKTKQRSVRQRLVGERYVRILSSCLLQTTTGLFFEERKCRHFEEMHQSILLTKKEDSTVDLRMRSLPRSLSGFWGSKAP